MKIEKVRIRSQFPIMVCAFVAGWNSLLQKYPFQTFPIKHYKTRIKTINQNVVIKLFESSTVELIHWFNKFCITQTDWARWFNPEAYRPPPPPQVT